MFGSFLALFLHSFRWWKPGKDKNIAGYVYLYSIVLSNSFVFVFKLYNCDSR